MRIEVAAPNGVATKVKGDLLEKFAAEFLRTQLFEVTDQVRLTGAELDALCAHQVDGRQIYVECKAYRQAIDAGILKNLEGTRSLLGYEEAWLVSTAPLGKDAKGLQHQIESRSRGRRQQVVIYTPERVVHAFTQAGLIKPQPREVAEETIRELERLGDWMLLITQYGTFWLVTCLEGGLPAGVLIFHAKTGSLVTERALLQNLANTDSSQASLNFEYVTTIDTHGGAADAESGNQPVAEVQFGESLDDYRPARPEFFSGVEEDHSPFGAGSGEAGDNPCFCHHGRLRDGEEFLDREAARPCS